MWKLMWTSPASIDVGSKARRGCTSQPRDLPHGRRQKPARRFLVEHPIDQVKLFVLMPIAKCARRHANREAIQAEEDAVGRAEHDSS